MNDLMSKPFSLNAKDFIRTAALAILVAVIGGVQQMLSAHGFDFASYDWGFIVNLGITAFTAQLGLNYISDKDRNMVTPFGKIG